MATRAKPSAPSSAQSWDDPALDDESDRVVANLFPDVLPISITHGEFPASAETFDVLGTPLGCIVTPFIATASRAEALEHGTSKIESGKLLARCAHCQAYINRYCELSQFSFACSLCAHRTPFTRSMVTTGFNCENLVSNNAHFFQLYCRVDINR
jgi:hypothetical protein